MLLNQSGLRVKGGVWELREKRVTTRSRRKVENAESPAVAFSPELGGFSSFLRHQFYTSILYFAGRYVQLLFLVDDTLYSMCCLCSLSLYFLSHPFFDTPYFWNSCYTPIVPLFRCDYIQKHELTQKRGIKREANRKAASQCKFPARPRRGKNKREIVMSIRDLLYAHHSRQSIAPISSDRVR